MRIGRLVARKPIQELTRFGDPTIGEELHRSIDGRVPDVRVEIAHALVELVARHVTFGVEKGFEDLISLLGVLEVVVLEIPRQGFALDFVRHLANVGKADPKSNQRIRSR